MERDCNFHELHSVVIVPNVLWQVAPAAATLTLLEGKAGVVVAWAVGDRVEIPVVLLDPHGQRSD